MDANLHQFDGPEAWRDLIEAVDPASLLMVIEAQISSQSGQCRTAEEILQDALLHAWRDRERFEWRGLRNFRSWLLSIIDSRISQVAYQDQAARCGDERWIASFSALDSTTSRPPRASALIEPAYWATPSRLAFRRQRAAAMRAALASLPADLRVVVLLRLYEQLSVDQIAQRLGISTVLVRHRFRTGAQLYQRQLSNELATQTMRPWTDSSSPAALAS